MRQSGNIRLPTHGIRTGPPQEQRNLPASTQSPIQRQGDNPDVGRRGTASLTANEEEKNVRAAAAFWAVMRTTHGLQNRNAATNDVTPQTESGTTLRQQAEASLENPRNPKRRRGSHGEYTEPTTTAALLGDIDTLTDSPTSRPNTKRCIQVGSETYAVTSQPRTPYTFDPRTDAGTILGQRLQPITAPASDDYDSILVIDSSSPPDHVDSGKKKRLSYRARKKAE